MAIRIFGSGPRIDNRDGAGAVPNNSEVDYFGLRVKMTPRMFLKLAAPLSSAESKDDEIAAFAKYIRNGGAIGAPFLDIDYDPDKPSELPRITGHEGRHRMLAVVEAYGDWNMPVETHLFWRYMRHRNFTPEIIDLFNSQLCPERLRSVVFKGPYFKVM